MIALHILDYARLKKYKLDFILVFYEMANEIFFFKLVQILKEISKS